MTYVIIIVGASISNPPASATPTRPNLLEIMYSKHRNDATESMGLLLAQAEIELVAGPVFCLVSIIPSYLLYLILKYIA
jgi:hypothetical protein